MKAIFVASGNKAVGTVSAFVRSQYDSLEKEGVEMVLFPVVGHGAKGYLKNLSALRRLPPFPDALQQGEQTRHRGIGLRLPEAAGHELQQCRVC